VTVRLMVMPMHNSTAPAACHCSADGSHPFTIPAKAPSQWTTMGVASQCLRSIESFSIEAFAASRRSATREITFAFGLIP
jgi:hypothetical protein